jgi:hypothetical protein
MKVLVAGTLTSKPAAMLKVKLLFIDIEEPTILTIPIILPLFNFFNAFITLTRSFVSPL